MLRGILNWVISKIVWVKLWYWNFEQPTSSCFSGSIVILFYIKNEPSFCSHFIMKLQKNKCSMNRLMEKWQTSKCSSSLLHAKEFVFDSLGLLDFAIGLVIFVVNLPDGQVLFFGEIQITEGLWSILLIKKGFGTFWNDLWASRC